MNKRLAVALSFLLGASAHAAPQQERYLVVLDPATRSAEKVAEQAARAHGGRVGYVYESALKGFSISLNEKAAQALARNPNVRSIERDSVVTVTAQTVPTGISRIFAASNSAFSIDGADNARVDADVAVLDTGIDREHPDLNVVGGVDCTASDGKGPAWKRTFFCDESRNGDDDQYHGTHVAGTIGALDNGSGVVGVAPGVRLWAVKVLGGDGSGSTSGIIAGIDWVVQQATIDVLNMSLGGSGVSSAYQTAIDNALAAGVVSVVAAGNSNADANNYSPAFVPNAVTVSAITDSDGLAGGLGDSNCRSTRDDTKADYSNWGTAVDIAAPGSCILSTYPIEQGSYAAISGTSMASPHVAGAAAVLASNGLSASQIISTLISSGNFNWVDTSPDGFLEPLLDVSSFSPTMVGGEPPQNQTPIASFSSSCSDLSCNFDASNSTDPDGSIVSYDWDFGDGSLQSGMAASYAFNSAGDYEVILTVRDNEGAENSVSKTVTVTDGQEPPPPPPETSLISSAINNGGTWTAIVETADGSALSGSWSTGDACSAASGACSLSGIRKKEASVVFVSEAGGQITVFKP